MIARADLYYANEQQSTYFYINALPMWQTINNGNWRFIEEMIRRTASNPKNPLNFDVWVGGIDILSLPDRTGAQKKIYLGINNKNGDAIVPVPKLIFKLIYNNKKREGLVFLTINNPYVENDIPSDYLLCNDVCKNFRNLGFGDRRKGFAYCCTIEDFLRHKRVAKLGLPIFLKTKVLKI